MAAERSEVWVNVGYRLSVFGFLACDKPRIEGNFGFKDQWMAFEWIRGNIEAFGGVIDGLACEQTLILLFHPSKRQEIRKIFKSQGYQQAGLVANLQNPAEHHLGFSRCTLNSSVIAPRLEAAVRSEGTIHVCCVAVKRHRVGIICYL